VVGGQPAALCFRECAHPILSVYESFVPHVIVPPSAPSGAPPSYASSSATAAAAAGAGLPGYSPAVTAPSAPSASDASGIALRLTPLAGMIRQTLYGTTQCTLPWKYGETIAPSAPAPLSETVVYRCGVCNFPPFCCCNCVSPLTLCVYACCRYAAALGGAAGNQSPVGPSGQLRHQLSARSPSSPRRALWRAWRWPSRRLSCRQLNGSA
jgi:hypothetical protein